MNRLQTFSRVAISTAAIAVTVAAILVSVRTLSDAADATGAGTRTLIVDKQAIQEQSKLGQDIQRQVLAYESKVEADLGPEGLALRNEAQQLRKEIPYLPAAERDKKVAVFQEKQAAYQKKVQARQSLVQGGQMAASQRYDTEVNAILHALMLERGANVLLFKSSAADHTPDIDITAAAIARLDKKLTSFKVTLMKPPANTMSMMSP